MFNWKDSGLCIYEHTNRHMSKYEDKENNTEFSLTLEICHWKALFQTISWFIERQWGPIPNK